MEAEWSREEEAALQAAFIESKPCADFWMQIAKKVPGKTPRECALKMYSSYSNPRGLSRRQALTDPPQTAMAAPEPAEEVEEDGEGLRRKQKSGKPSLKEARKIVREKMRAQLLADEGFEEDAFAALEFPAASDDRRALVVMDSNLLGDRNVVVKVEDRKGTSSAAAAAAGLGKRLENASPEVLKRGVNQKQVDKYVDQVHSRRRLDGKKTKAARRRGVGGNKIKGFSSLTPAKRSAVLTPEEFLKRLSKMGQENSDGIDHTFDEELEDASLDSDG